jgi:hypothetical protein
VPRSQQEDHGLDKQSRPEDDSEAMQSGTEAEEEGPDEGLCPAA